MRSLAELTGTKLGKESYGDYIINDVGPLDRASDHEISFLDNPKYVDLFRSSRAAACIVKERYASEAPEGMKLLVSEDPYRAYALIAQYFYPYVPLEETVTSHAHIDATAKLGSNVIVAPGAVIGRNAEIGEDCIIGANTVIHDGVVIGAHSRIGALCSISHSVIGSNVIMHRGVHIGQDGFGFSMGRDGHVKVPQLGRVIIGNDVEIGAGTCIDRGTGPDTIIGDGSKIDNLVQIGHNVQIGRNVVIVAQCGISGSTRIGDGTILAGQIGIAGHLRIGAGVRIAAQSGVMNDIPAGASYGGSPALPIKNWHRQTVMLARLVKPQETETPDDGEAKDL